MLILRECCGHLGTGNDKVEGVGKCAVAVEQAEIYELDVPNSSESAATKPNYPRFVLPVGSYVARILLPQGSGVEGRETTDLQRHRQPVYPNREPAIFLCFLAAPELSD
jgi:hypothetical protein